MLDPARKQPQLYLVASKPAAAVTAKPRGVRAKQDKQREKLTERPEIGSLFKTRFQWIIERLEDKHPGMAQTWVGMKYGLDSAQTSRFQDGPSEPTFGVLRKFCQKSRANPTYLVLGEGEDFL